MSGLGAELAATVTDAFWCYKPAPVVYAAAELRRVSVVRKSAGPREGGRLEVARLMRTNDGCQWRLVWRLAAGRGLCFC